MWMRIPRPTALNEGRGVNPGDTSLAVDSQGRTVSLTAQRRPGSKPRRHQAKPEVRSRLRTPYALNEGRGVNPGDTQIRLRGATDRCAGPRSTKAGE